jgi:hypothetical protein
MNWSELEARSSGSKAMLIPLVPRFINGHKEACRDTFTRKNKAELLDTLRSLREAAAMGDISAVQDQVLEATWAFNIELDEHSPAYIKLGTACLHSYLRAFEAIASGTQASPWRPQRSPRTVQRQQKEGR